MSWNPSLRGSLSGGRGVIRRVDRQNQRLNGRHCCQHPQCLENRFQSTPDPFSFVVRFGGTKKRSFLGHCNIARLPKNKAHSSGSPLWVRDAEGAFKKQSPFPHCSYYVGFEPMDRQAQQHRRRDNPLSSLDVTIAALNLAKELSAITPAKAVFGSASAVLTMIRASVPLVYFGRLQAETHLGFDD